MLNKKYDSVPSSLANYNFIDIASGTGIIEFYAGKAIDSNMMSNNKFYSNGIGTPSSIISGENYAKFLDMDFDVTINRPTIIQGKSIVNVPYLAKNAGSNSTASFYAVVILKKYANSTETQIATNNGTIYSKTVTSTIICLMDSIDLTIPQTDFKVGDVLRLTIELWGKEAAPANYYLYLGHDPMDRPHNPEDSTPTYDFGTEHSILTFQCPVVIDV